MAFCKNCGAENEPNAKFCPNCGQTITADNQTVYNQNSENYTPYPNNPIPYARPTNESVPPKTNAFAITGFVMSICSFVICCLDFLCIPALIFSIIGLIQIKKNNQKGMAFAIVGLILSGLTLVMLLFGILFNLLVNVFHVDNYLNQFFYEIFPDSYNPFEHI